MIPCLSLTSLIMILLKRELPLLIFSLITIIISLLYNIGKLRIACFDNIQKTILCHTIYHGCDFLQYPKCGKETMITHSCHSHFCTQCGAKETKQRSAFVSTMALEAKHRHIVLTIPWEMREYLIKHRVLLDDLFTAARNTLACLFNDTKYRKASIKMISSII